MEKAGAAREVRGASGRRGYVRVVPLRGGAVFAGRGLLSAGACGAWVAALGRAEGLSGFLGSLADCLSQLGGNFSSLGTS
jgi:hypothetical protein